MSITPLAGSIAVDAANGLLYSGAGFLNNHNLTQYDLAARTERAVVVEPDASAAGIAVDPSTGYVYVSADRNRLSGGDDLIVFDRLLTQIDLVPIDGNPGALVVSSRSLGRRALSLVKNIADGLEYVEIGDTITYDICFDNNDNDFAAINIPITDTLPVEVNFVTADGDGVFGQYDPAMHRYMWSYMSLLPGEHACLQMVVQVNQNAAPGKTITNFVTIGGGAIPPVTSCLDIDMNDIAYNPLNLTKSIVGAVGEPIDYAYIGQNITYNICFDNNDHGFPITDVRIVDRLPHEVDFVVADGDGSFGQYDPNTHTYTWSYSCLEPGASHCLQLVVQVNQNPEPNNSTITNSVTVTADQTPPTTASVDVVRCESEPVQADLRIVRLSLRPRRRLNDIMVIVKLPPGINESDIQP